MKTKTICSTIALTWCSLLPAQNKHHLCPDSDLEKQIYQSGMIHQPLPIDTMHSFEHDGWKKNIIFRTPITNDKNLTGWRHKGEGEIRIGYNKGIDQGNCLLMTHPYSTGKRAIGSPSDPDYAIYGTCKATYLIGGKNLEKYNRMAFAVYPDCDGARVVTMNLSFTNGASKQKKGYNAPSGSHSINLVNKKWNYCFLEIDEYQRDKVEEISFSVSLNGKDRINGDSARYYIDKLEWQKIENPEKVSGWDPMDNRIVYPTTGYTQKGEKQAIVSHHMANENKTYQLCDPSAGNAVVWEGNITPTATTIGSFGIIDFSGFQKQGKYILKVGNTMTSPFIIAPNIWEPSQWKVLNFLFCQRCGHPVPGKHSMCHTDLLAKHNDMYIPYSGGWHDAGDLSQQTLQTGDVVFSLLEAYASANRKGNIALASRLREEAEWGLDFLTKCRFGDGYRASSMGLLIWQDGILNTFDDIKSVRVQNHAFDNFLFSAYEAYAALVLDNDPARQEYLRKIAEEDFGFALEKFKKDGFDRFNQPYEHTYNTSKSQYMATMSWAASQLYRLTHQEKYARWAAEFIRYTLDCQQTSPIEDEAKTCGFFYRDKERKSIVHYIHQSREQIYMQSLTLLCETQKHHQDYPRWANAIKLYGQYIKGMMRYTAPYGMIPSGVYKTDEYNDSTGFYALHLFPPADAQQRYMHQLRNGIKLDDKHYVKRFPVWFNIFNGNTAVHLSTGKAAALCGHFLNDSTLLNIGREQLYWTVGKNPFNQSLIYGEGVRYPQMNSFSSGEITGEMPVGIRTIGDEDTPYWPQTNNACYKEVWVTSAGKWLSLLAEYTD